MMEKTRRVRAFHERHAADYTAERYDGLGCEQLAYRIRKRIVLDMLAGTSGITVDVGCGPGIYTRDLAALGHQPVCIDLSLGMLEVGRRSIASPVPALWISSEIEQLPLRDSSVDNALA